MKPWLKGALLSGLVFPGLGQVVLRRRKTGMGFVLVTVAGIIGLIYGIVQQMQLVLARLTPELEQGTLTMGRIFEEAHRLTESGTMTVTGISIWVIVVCWLAAIVHAIRQGIKMEAAGPQDLELVRK